MTPRIRIVKPELFKHELLFEAETASKLPLRLGFMALFSCCDRAGRFRWQPRRLKLEMFPHDDLDMTKVLDAFLNYGFIKKYQRGEVWYGCIPSWSRHQPIDPYEPESDIPAISETESV
jgi:hypothetical protein